MAEIKRSVRVAERVREQLSTLIARRVRDPRAQKAIVIRVEMAGDLRSARVYIRTLDGEEIDAVVRALNKASGFLKSEVTHALGLRFAPELEFRYDAGQEARDRIDALLREIEDERKKSQ
jgi:ribosome-binding factor A